MELPREIQRQRLAWWLVGGALLLVVGAFLTKFVGTFVLGLFVYYGVRPIHRHLDRDHVPRTWAAALTMLLLVLPILVLLSYVALIAFQEFATLVGQDATRQVLRRLGLDPTALADAIRHPVTFLATLEHLERLRQRLETGLSTLGVITTWLLHVTLAMTFTFFLLRDGTRLERWFRREVAGDGTTAHAFLSAVDADLETVYFGNVVTVLLVTAVSMAVYNGFNYLAPAEFALPFPTLLALLTGLATFVPLVVGKLVYLPVTAYLVWEAIRVDAGLLWVPVAFLGVSFVALDLVPQAILRPMLSGRSLHTGLVLFAYVLGTAYFGWYGLFLGPLLMTLVVQFVKEVLPELVHGRELTAEPSERFGLGSDPQDGVEGGQDRHAIDEPNPVGDGDEVEVDDGVEIDGEVEDGDGAETR